MPLTMEMNPKLQKRLKQLKARAGLVNHLNISTTEIGTRSKKYFEDKLKERVVCGYACKWGHKNMHGQKMVKGACAKSISDRGPDSQANYKLTFLWQHNQSDPLALFAKLEEDDYGLYFETKPLDDVPNADRLLKQIKSGTINQFSIGFDYVWDKIEYDKEDDSLVLLEIDLFEISGVTIGSDSGTHACRSLEQITDLYDDIENFISTLPRQNRMAARELFTRQKALIDLEPFEEAEKTLEEHKPLQERKVDWIAVIDKL